MRPAPDVVLSPPALSTAAALAVALTFATAGLPSAALAADSPPVTAAPGPPPGAPPNMESVQLVLLMRAPTWKKLPEAEANALQAAHIAHLVKMGESGKAVVCGPFASQQDPTFRGACLYTVATPAEARELASQDPTVKAGQLRVEVVTWWFEKGYMTFPKASQESKPPPATQKPTAPDR